MLKILIIKLGALGDVIRTFPLLKAIKEKYPISEITWITKDNVIELVKEEAYVDFALTKKDYPGGSFDILYNFDIDEEATNLAMGIPAKTKYGFYSEAGFQAAFNLGAEYYLNTLFDDDLKRTNKKTYQEMMFDVAELPYEKKLATINLTEKDKDYARRFVSDNGINTSNLIGIHLGASPRWPSKSWSEERLREFILKSKKLGNNIIIFGGPAEKEKHSKFISDLKEKGVEIYENNPYNTLKEFVSLVDICDTLVCSDSLAMHVGLALKKPTVALFFCTTPHEVEGYGYLKKVISPMLYEFFPEKQDEYSEDLVNSISAEEVLERVKENTSVRAVNVVIFNSNNEKFLTIKRQGGEIHPYKWAFPGGVVEQGETTEMAIRREIKEEVGLDLEEVYEKISEYTYSREDGSKTIGICYLIKTKNTDILKGKEINDFMWVTPEEFENMDFIEGLNEEALIAFLNKNK